MCVLIFYLEFRFLNKFKTMKVDEKVQALLLADPNEFEKVFMPGLGNKSLYMYFNNVFSPGKLFVLFSAMLLVLYPKNVFLKISTFLLLLIFVSFDKFIDHFSISFLVHFPSLYQKFLKYLYNFVCLISVWLSYCHQLFWW